jgi:hypothetical protein
MFLADLYKIEDNILLKVSKKFGRDDRRFAHFLSKLCVKAKPFIHGSYRYRYHYKI